MDTKFLRSAVREGLQSMRPQSPTIDKDLHNYNQLVPSDFKDLMNAFGADAVAEYVKTMELQRTRSK